VGANTNILLMNCPFISWAREASMFRPGGKRSLHSYEEGPGTCSVALVTNGAFTSSFGRWVCSSEMAGYGMSGNTISVARKDMMDRSSSSSWISEVTTIMRLRF
jgi:hypothetical protein